MMQFCVRVQALQPAFQLAYLGLGKTVEHFDWYQEGRAEPSIGL